MRCASSGKAFHDEITEGTKERRKWFMGAKRLSVVKRAGAIEIWYTTQCINVW